MVKGPTASGLSRMRELASTLPRQLHDGFRRARELEVPVPRGVRGACAFGMGGSAIASDLLSSLLNSETELPLVICRSPEVPRSFDSSTLGLFVSYSGNTWETLQAYTEAGRRGGPRFVLSSGGTLAEWAERDGVPRIVVPPGMPPRSSVGFLFGALLGLLDAFFATSNEERVESAVESLGRLIHSIERRGSVAARLARAIGARSPYFYADEAFAPVARRWKTQVEENAKRLASFDVVPELFHNALVGWDAIRRSDASRVAPVFLEWAGQPASTTARFRYLGRLLRSRQVRSVSVRFDAEDRLLALLQGVAYGDQASLFLAEAAGVDPYPVHAIERMKHALEKAG